MNSAGASDGSDELPKEIEVFHVMPTSDSVEHYESPNCICEPVLEYRDPHNGNEVWVHRIVRESLN